MEITSEENIKYKAKEANDSDEPAFTNTNGLNEKRPETASMRKNLRELLPSLETIDKWQIAIRTSSRS